MTDNSTSDDHSSDQAEARDKRPLAADPSALHALVDELSRALHSYVDVSTGVRAEFDADTADNDPRVEEAEEAIERLNSAFDEKFTAVLGMTSAHTSYSFDDDDEEDDAEYESLQLEMLLEREGHTEEELDDALELLDSAAESVAEMLESRGFEIPQWIVSHEQYEDDDEDDELTETTGPSGLPDLDGGFDAGVAELFDNDGTGTEPTDGGTASDGSADSDGGSSDGGGTR